MAASSLRAIKDARSGVLCFGSSSHFPNCVTIKDETISLIAGEENHSALVCQSGRAFVVRNNGGTNVLKQVAGLSAVRVVDVACGNSFTCFLSSDGELFAGGVNDRGQLGTGDHVDVSYLAPVKVEGLPKVKAVAAGDAHAVALTADGTVWATGHNAQGQLGMGHFVDQSRMKEVSPAGVTVVQVSCGGNHTALVSDNGRLYVAGSNKYGILGLGDVCDIDTFQTVTLPSSVPVASVACGQNHTVALTVEGTVWAWGQNYYGQLGVKDKIEISYTPAPMCGLEDYFVTQILAGTEHTALITDESRVLVCGSGGEGELGFEDKNDIYIPALFPLKLPADLRVKQVVCVSNATLVLVERSERAVEPPVVIPARVAAPAGITDWEKSIMTTLECPICFKIMCAPIHQCTKGHNFCDACRKRSETHECCLCREPFIGTRNMALEALGDALKLPCSDCLIRMPVTHLDKHASVCVERSFGCPISKSCGWTGRPDAILVHASTKHRPQTWDKLPRSCTHNFNDGLHSTLLAAHGVVFVLYRRFDHNSDGFRAVAKFVGVLKPEITYELQVEFTTTQNHGKDLRLVYSKDVCCHGDDVNELLFSDNAIVLKRKHFGTFFRHNQVSCSVQILAKRQDN